MKKPKKAEATPAILFPQELQTFDVGRRIHRVEDDVLAKLGDYIRMKLFEHTSQNWEAVIIRALGKGCITYANVWQQSVDTERREWLRDLCVKCNERASYDGFWVWAWSDVSNQATMMAVGFWFDRDGDLHVIHDTDERSWARLKRFEIEDLVTNSDAAIQGWASAFGKLDLKPDQLAKVAQGERPN